MASLCWNSVSVKLDSTDYRKKANCKRKSLVQKLDTCTLGDLATKLDMYGRHSYFDIMEFGCRI